MVSAVDQAPSPRLAIAEFYLGQCSG